MKSRRFSLWSTILTIAFCASCTDEKTVRDQESIKEEDSSELVASPVKSQKAFDKGYSIGKHIAEMDNGSREKESALLEVYSIISGLERNGFRQSAIDFSKGVNAALKE